MLDEQDGDLELVADLLDVLHQLLGLGRVHAGRGLVEQQHLGAGGQRAQNLEAALGAVREVARLRVRELAHVKDVEKLERAIVELRLLLPVPREAQHVGDQVRLHGVAKAHEHVLLDRHLGEEADVLERARDAHAVDLGHGLAGRVVAVDEDGAARGRVDVGEQVEDRGLAGSVGADQARDLGPAHGDVEVVDGSEASEVDAQVLGLQHRDGAEVALGNEVGRLDLNEDRTALHPIGHRRSPPRRLRPSRRPCPSSRGSPGSSRARSRGRARSRSCREDPGA